MEDLDRLIKSVNFIPPYFVCNLQCFSTGVIWTVIMKLGMCRAACVWQMIWSGHYFINGHYFFLFFFMKGRFLNVLMTFQTAVVFLYILFFINNVCTLFLFIGSWIFNIISSFEILWDFCFASMLRRNAVFSRGFLGLLDYKSDSIFFFKLNFF